LQSNQIETPARFLAGASNSKPILPSG
jgi:hypothetical protein